MLVAQNSLGPVCPVPLTVRGKEENWDPDSSDDDTTLLDQILGDNLALAVGTLEWDLPHMRRNLGGAHPDVLALEEILLQARDVLRAREASRLGF